MEGEFLGHARKALAVATVTAGAFASLAFLACGSSATGPGSPPAESATISALYVLPDSLETLANEHFLDHPWPSDFRREADGTVRIEGFFDPKSLVLLQDYVRLSKGLFDGFSPVASGYVRFDGDIDPKSLPADPRASLSPLSSVQIIDVDPSSADLGKRHLASAYFRKDEGVYWLPRTLAIAPALGHPLRTNHRYAQVVTKALLTTSGTPTVPSIDMRRALGLEPATGRSLVQKEAIAKDVEALRAAGVATADIVSLSVFTTTDPTAELYRVTDAVAAQVPAPTAKPEAWQAKEQGAAYDVYEGVYGPSPDYQAGTTPFRSSAEGGGFEFDGSGKPVLQRTLDLRFAVAVPNARACPMPESGYPIVLSAHGTTGDYRTAVDDTETSVAALLAPSCLAVIGIDQILHGTRPGAPPVSSPTRDSDIEILFFNFSNMLAGRTNGRQGAVDVVQEARLFTESNLSVPANVARGGAPIRFDASKMTFFGHSQGGLNGTLFLAADGHARGGVLSGSGSMITTALLEKTQPQPSVATAIKLLLQLTSPADAAELNVFHPVLNLAQELVDVTDPIHYARHIVSDPRKGNRPKSILQTEGVGPDGKGDTFAPPIGIELSATAMGLPRIAPGVWPVQSMSWTGAVDLSVPPAGVSGNLGGGLATGALAQWAPRAGVDGHFVVFFVPGAKRQASNFMRDLAGDPRGKLLP